MRLNFTSFVDCSNHVFLAFVPFVPSFRVHPSCLRKYESPRTPSLVLSNPFISTTLLRSHTIDRISKSDTLRRSCSSNLDDVEESVFQVEGDGEEGKGHTEKKVHCTISSDQDLFLHSRFDFLEPMMIGIKPEFPDWPNQETSTWATIERKAKSLDFPLSLRMIKKKLQCEEGFVDTKESSAYCPVKVAFASMVYIIVELQSYALHMRETLCHEDLEIISAKVQKDMHSSFVWLFQQVFSRTPALMLQVMVLLANFSLYSASHGAVVTETQPSITFIESTNPTLGDQIQHYNVEENTGNNQLESLAEMNLWNSMVDDAEMMQEGVKDEVVLEHETMLHFVSPVSVELQPDDYEDYLRTDLLYQLTLSQEPNNPLLLCNYAQFLHLVAHDYDRAEECYKRAVQALPPDAESLNQYANFLWTVKRDFFGAEERFLQALSVEPNNPHYASRYANFLWSTGGDETCFPLNNSLEPNT